MVMLVSAQIVDELKSMGGMRYMLHGLAIAFMIVLPFAEPTWNPRGWDVVLGAVVPAVSLLVFIVIMLDVLMSKVFQSDAQDTAVKNHYGFIVKANLGIAILLMLFWLSAFREALF